MGSNHGSVHTSYGHRTGNFITGDAPLPIPGPVVATGAPPNDERRRLIMAAPRQSSMGAGGAGVLDHPQPDADGYAPRRTAVQVISTEADVVLRNPIDSFAHLRPAPPPFHMINPAQLGTIKAGDFLSPGAGGLEGCWELAESEEARWLIVRSVDGPSLRCMISRPRR